MHLMMTTMLLVVMMIMTSSSVAAKGEPLADCQGGTCPSPVNINDAECGLWLGPSTIKNAEDHGFGLGMFTGRFIPKGSTVESLYSVGGEVLIPIFASRIYKTNPPLREYVWSADNMPEIPTENRHGTTSLFIPGLAAFAPCTSQNYNLELSSSTGGAVVDSDSVHRARNPTAGSFSYRHNVTYTAVRDIVPGEELTVYCSDDNFDGGAYFLSSFQSSDDAVVCLDNNLRIDISTIAGAGRGLFAKRNISEGSVITSTPLVPIHRKALDIVIKDKESPAISPKQLILNYCYGHPNSDLLLLPYGPLASHFNHALRANAVLRWHNLTETNEELRRKQFHHPEVFQLPADEVAETHRKGLMMDIVALRHIKANEEVLLDYGPEWTEAYKAQVDAWPQEGDTYMSASNYVASSARAVLRTEDEQKSDPYPDNLRTMCFYSKHIPNPKPGEDHEEYSTFNEGEENKCIRPCIILQRYEEDSRALYTVKMSPSDNAGVPRKCRLKSVTLVNDMPVHAIRILDRPYTADMFLPKAFRREIGVPDGFYPVNWMKKNLRQQPKGEGGGDIFKRKQAIKEE